MISRICGLTCADGFGGFGSCYYTAVVINVVGCGTRVPNGMRQNRCQEVELATSRHSDS